MPPNKKSNLQNIPSAGSTMTPVKWALLSFACIAAVLLFLFHSSFDPDKVLFSNDGPLGAKNSTFSRLPAGFHGVWQDLNWIGKDGGSNVPNIDAGLDTLLGPLYG